MTGSSSRKGRKANILALKSSRIIVGQLQHAVVCKQHPERFLLGNNRKLAFGPNLETATYDVDTFARKMEITHEAAEEVISVHGNIQRQIKGSETKERMLKIASGLEASGVPKEKISSKLVNLLGFSPSYVCKLLPVEYKQSEYARSPGRPRRAHGTGGAVFLGKQKEVTYTKLGTIPTMEQPTEFRSQRVDCFNCNTSFPRGSISMIPACPPCVAELHLRPVSANPPPL